MMSKLSQPLLLSLVALLSLSACNKPPKEITRYKLPESNFPIALGVEIPAGRSLVFVSGMTPTAVNADAAKDSVEAYGDTKTQTVSVLKRVDGALKSMNLTMKDVVKMQVFLVGDPAKGGKLDFAGMMEGYTQFFGTAEQPNLPSRSAMQVVALANPGFLVEIEVAAVRP
jgi:enamine deaminase RidA (YjgF/YER057c/UK114 family)